MKMTIKEAFFMVDALRDASPATHARLLGCASLKEFGRRQVILHEKQEQSSVYMLADGAVSVYKTSAGGEKKILMLLRAGAVINGGALSVDLSDAGCETLKESFVLCIPVQDFLRAMSEDFPLVRAVLDAANSKISRLQRHLKNTPNSVVGEKKLAAKLYKLAVDFGVNGAYGTTIDLDLSVTYLADMLGQKRETVSRQLKVLRENGFVKSAGQAFVIPDMDRLSDFFHGS
ncbi:Crp/Fnr family transcriptional regulator [Christensenellaceae bacterium OttesenSCG-928-K19]|nr:Crp/Fnr family transcriptional regulator [Christensenellaceae bacterium OttesenSCG-928-K19]